jgi:hypothetical protein
MLFAANPEPALHAACALLQLPLMVPTTSIPALLAQQSHKG